MEILTRIYRQHKSVIQKHTRQGYNPRCITLAIKHKYKNTSLQQEDRSNSLSSKSLSQVQLI